MSKLWRLLCCAVAAAGLVVQPASHAAAAEIRTVALTGQQAPGAVTGAVFNAFTTGPRLNNAGRVAFEGTLTGTGVTAANDLGVWSDGAGSLALVAREGLQAVGLPAGELYGGASFRTVLNDLGSTVIHSVTSASTHAIWSETAGGAVTLIARSGVQAPGALSGVALSTIAPTPRMNDAGQVLFSGSVSGTGIDAANDWGIWLYSSGTTGLIAREGSPAPHTPAGVNFGHVASTLLNGAGQTAFTATLIGEGVTAANGIGIWAGGVDSLTLTARAGDPAPGASAAVSFADFSFFPTLNAAGQVAFKASLAGAGVSTANDTGIWSTGGGSLGLVAREGSLAAGMGAGVNYGELADPVMNAAGETAFRAPLAGEGINASNDTGLWFGLPGSLDLIAREGAAAPGTPEGVAFAVFDAPVLNAAGQIAFVGGLTGVGVTASNDRGIWATDAAGALQLIVREGDSIEVAPGVMRTVNALATLVSTGDDGGGPSGFNDAGELAFTTSFTDGSSGAFVSSRVQTPGDFNRDGSVDAADLVTWRNDFGGTAPNLSADDDNDGDVDGADFLAWQRSLSAPGATAHPIAEPTNCLLAALAIAAIAHLAEARRLTNRETRPSPPLQNGR